MALFNKIDNVVRYLQVFLNKGYLNLSSIPSIRLLNKVVRSQKDLFASIREINFNKYKFHTLKLF